MKFVIVTLPLGKVYGVWEQRAAHPPAGSK
jgi:hypothetical protein